MEKLFILCFLLASLFAFFPVMQSHPKPHFATDPIDGPQVVLETVEFTNFDDDVNFVHNTWIHSISAESVRWIVNDGTLIGVYEPVECERYAC